MDSTLFTSIPAVTEAMLNELADRNGLSKLALIEVSVSQAYSSNWSLTTLSQPIGLPSEELIDYGVLKQMLNESVYASVTEYLKAKGIVSWVGFGKLGRKKLLKIEGIGSYTMDSIGRLLEDYNVLLGD